MHAKKVAGGAFQHCAFITGHLFLILSVWHLEKTETCTQYKRGPGTAIFMSTNPLHLKPTGVLFSNENKMATQLIMAVFYRKKANI
jgi:hypothetical protein